jgi:hypothetical protein
MNKNEKPRIVIDLEDLREVTSQKTNAADDKAVVKVTGGGKACVKTSARCPF